MIDAESFMKNSPFQVTHGDEASYNLSNTTPELLKFQLQEQYRNKLRDLKGNHVDLPNLSLLNSQFLEGSFNNHLQSVVDDKDQIPSLSSTPMSESQDDESLVLKPNYLNLKVLIENSVFETSKINKDSILSLDKIKTLKELIADKNDLKQYLVSRITLSQQFTTNMVLTPEKSSDIDLDSSLLLKILKLNHSLSNQLLLLNEELDYLQNKLNNHNLACLALGYIEDVKLTSNHLIKSKSNPGLSTNNLDNDIDSIPAIFEKLFSHIVQIAVQRNINLPSPPSTSNTNLLTLLQVKMDWAQDCIDTILSSKESIQPQTPNEDSDTSINDASFLSASPYRSVKSSKEKLMAEYKTALNDLRFSHHFLLKEYEHSKENSIKLIQEYRKKNTYLEKELSKYQKLNSKSESPILNDETTLVHPTNKQVIMSSPLLSEGSESGFQNYDSITLKDKEIAKLRKELNLLKIEKLGTKSNSSHHNLSPSMLTSNDSPESFRLMLNNLESDLLSINDNSNSLDRPGNFDDENDMSISTRPTSMSAPSSTSNGILRKEFKKIVSDIQDQYELELEEERFKRRQLQDQLANLNKA